MIAHLPLNGDADDKSGNGLVFTPTDVSFAAGKIGQAGLFNGSTSIVDGGDQPEFRLAAYTLSAWVRSERAPAGASKYWYIANRGNIFREGYGLAVYDRYDGPLIVAWNRDGATVRSVSAAEGNNWTDITDWNHICGTYDGTTLRLYVNGSLAVEHLSDPPDTTAGALFCIGGDDQYSSSGWNWKGDVDDVRLYDNALSALQVKRIYNRGNGTERQRLWPSIIAHYKLNGNARDASGWENHGTPTDVSWAKGKIGQAGLFNGTSSHVNCGQLGNLGSNLGAGLTLTAWIKTSYTGGIACIFGYQVNTNGIGYIALASNYTPSGGVGADALTMDLRDWSGNRLRFGVYSGSGVTDGEWHHVAAVCSPSGGGTPWGEIYIDGVALNVVYGYRQQQNDWQNITTFLALGADRYGAGSVGLYFSGQIDDARVYNEALEAWQVKPIASPPNEEAEPWQTAIKRPVSRLIPPLIGAA